MKIPHIAALAVLVLSSFAATGVAPTKSELESMYDKAFQEFDGNHYDAALKALDAIDARQPDLAESYNLRGVVLMRKGDYDKAEAALRHALDIEPKFWNAQFNLAEIPFLKKNWTEARNRFEALVAGNSEEMRPETKLLIQYKILLTFVLQGRENMVDWIINKFEGEKDSPALYYSHAALALHHHNQKEADEWMDAANKHYSPELNKLFAESFYEIGWLDKPAGESRAAVEITSTAERAERMKADAQANYERAERAFQQRDFPTALKDLDLADQGAPNQAPYLNLRGEIFMEQKKFDEAEAQFRKAYEADPKFREAQYNLAQIPFKKKEYAKSRERLEALFGETPGGDKNQAAQLIKYKIYMTLLLEGKDSQAQRIMEQFKFTGDTPALYYAQAAWAFKHGNNGQGNDWVSSARKIYSPALNIVFADSFYDLGWLKPEKQTAPPTTALAQANAFPAGPKPQMRFGEAGDLPAPVTAASPAPSAAATTTSAAATNNSPAASPAAIAANKTAPATTSAAASPAASVAPRAAKVAATNPPAVAPEKKQNVAANTATVAPQKNNVAAATKPAVAPTSAPQVAAKPAATPAKIIAAVPAPAATVAATAAPKIAASSPSAPAVAAASTAAPTEKPHRRGFSFFGFGHKGKRAAAAPAPAQVQAMERPTWAEAVKSFSQPRMIVFLALFLAGVILFAWLMLQQLRRDTDGGSALESALPFPQPSFAGAGAAGVMPVNERRLPRNFLRATPPKISVQLRGSEHVMRAAVPPSALTATRASAPSTNGSAKKITSNGSSARTPSITAPEESKWSLPNDETVSEVKAIAPAPESPVSDATGLAPAQVVPIEPADEMTTTIVPNEPAPDDRAGAISLRDEEEVSLAAAPRPIEEPQPEPAALAATEEAPAAKSEEPVNQGEPVPQLIVPAATELELAETSDEEKAEAPVVSEEESASETEAVAEETEPAVEIADTAETATPAAASLPEQEPAPEPATETEEPAAPAIAEEKEEEHSSIETPAFASKIITTQTEPPLITPIIIMPEPTPITAINEPRPVTPNAPGAMPATTGATAMTGAPPSAAMQTAVQLTFSLEIASLQLTPTFKMGQLQVKPISKIVAMRLAPSSQPQPAMNLQVTFELSSVQLGAGATLGTVRLTPSSAQRPSLITTPTFEIAGLQLVSGSASAPVQLTPTHQAQASVLMTASFQIATVEFSPSFEIASVVLNATSKTVSVQLPGAGPSSIEAAPVFEIGTVQLGGNNEIASILLNPLGGGRRA